MEPVARNTEQIVPVLREPIDGMPVSVDELDTMESLLADFVGPAATMIMEEHETQSTSAYNLAIEISKEIPEQEGQTEFLKRWGSLSASRQKFINRKRAEIEADKARKRSFPGDVLHKIGVDFSQYVGPLASNLLRHRPLKTGKPETPPKAAEAAEAAAEPAALRD